VCSLRKNPHDSAAWQILAALDYAVAPRHAFEWGAATPIRIRHHVAPGAGVVAACLLIIPAGHATVAGESSTYAKMASALIWLAAPLHGARAR